MVTVGRTHKHLTLYKQKIKIAKRYTDGINCYRVFEPLQSADPDRIYASHKGFYALIFDNIISEFCEYF